MGEAYDLATELAEIARTEGKGFVLVCRTDGTFQMTMTEAEPYPERPETE